MDEREQYWIKYYDSYNCGYNRTKGGTSNRGESHPRAFLTEQDVWNIREMYAQHIGRSKAYEKFKHTGISERGFKKVWDNENWQGIHDDVYTPENLLWHTMNTGHSEDQIGKSSLMRAISQQEIDKMYQDYKNGMSINAIAKKYNRDNGVVEKYMKNPVAITEVKYRGRKVKNLNTGLIFKSISAAAKWAGCGSTTLTRHLNGDKIAGKVPETLEPAEWEEIS